MEYSFQIGLLDNDIPAKALMLIKRTTGISFAEVKQKTAMGEPFFSCSLSDDKRLQTIVNLYKSLEAQNVQAQLYDTGKPETIDVLENTLASHIDTSNELGFDEFEI